MNLFFILFIINISIFLCYESFGGNYPYSIKYGFTNVVSFMDDKLVAIFTDESVPPLYSNNIATDCLTRTEKGAIYLNGLYYLSCLDPTPNNYKFNIKVFNKDNGLLEKYKYPNDGTYLGFNQDSSIRFFIINSNKIRVGVSWLNGDKFYIILCDREKCDYQTEFPMEHFARDFDCLYMSKFQRLVCGFGIISNGIYDCSVNLFNIKDERIEYISNLKPSPDTPCSNHHSRKLRGNSDVNIDSNFFYYYFVDTDNKAYVLKVIMNSATNIDYIGPMFIMSGCSQLQNSFDLAEDKFLGYNVFSCVDSQYGGTRIKMKLFNIIDSEVVFYEDKVIEPYDTVGEASMINFIVLKDSLDYGFLSYGINQEAEGRYFTFTQPKCENFKVEGSDSVMQGKETNIDFLLYLTIKSDDKIKIVKENLGMEITPKHDATTFNFKSTEFVSDKLEFEYRVYNNYFESPPCTVEVTVNKCHDYCSSCDAKGSRFIDQKCNECKSGLYEMKFPKDYAEKNCCEKGFDCYNYLYESETTDNLFEICEEKCTTCKNKEKCITCNNDVELNKIDYNTREEIKNFKTSGKKYYWNEDQTDCVEFDELNPNEKYLDPETLTIKSCYFTCSKCKGHGIATEHNCTECKTGYYPFGSENSQNCVEKNGDSPLGYYIKMGVSRPYLKKCNEVCSKCLNSDQPDDCYDCAIGAYRKCTVTAGPYQCYKRNNKPSDSYFLDEENECFKQCDSSCLTCDQEASGDSASDKNCLSCDENLILYERNCIKNCPITHKKLENKKCVLECPSYTFSEDYQDTDEDGVLQTYYRCVNCKNKNPTKELCIYMGTRHANAPGVDDCIECDSLSQTFWANKNFNIMDDCFERCEECTERGTSTKMNCKSCIDDNFPCLEEVNGNCYARGETIDGFVEKPGSDANGDPICVYKKCYDTCKKCSDQGVGDILEHKCDECKDGYQFDPLNPGNCVIVCPYYWYVDSSTNLFTCTTEPKCPEDKPYFTEINKGCYEECSAVVHSVQRNFYRYKKTCITQCPNNSMRDDKLYVCHSLDDEKDIFVYMANYISQSSSVNNLLLYSTDQTKLFHLFNTSDLGLKTYKNNSLSVGTSIIDLSTCINTLKHIEGFDSNTALYIGVLDIIRDDTSAPQFEYTIFNKNGKKLDINYCKSNELVIEKSLNFSNNISLAKNILENYGYDIIDYQKNNKFFCDICSVFDYDKLDAYDVLLNDRYDYYYDNQNYYFCEDTCKAQSTEVDLKKLRVKCVCSGKTNFTSYKKSPFQKYQKFSQNCKDEFLQYFKCGNLVFSKDLFTKNVGNYFLFFFILFQIGDVFLYYFYSKTPMMSHINDVLVKRAKKGYENDEISSSQSEQSQSQTESQQSGSYSGNGSQRSGSGSGSRSYSGSGNGSQRSGSGSQRSGNQSGSQRSGSQSGSQRSGSQSQSGNHEENEDGNQEGSQNGSQTGSQSASQNGSQRGSQSGQSKRSKGSKTSKKNANPPKVGSGKTEEKKEKTQYAFISLDNKNEEEKNKNENLETNDILNINNINNNDLVQEKEYEEKSSTGDNKNAPNPAWKKYAKRYLNNENKYVDNEYREDSYNFDIPKEKKKKNNSDSDSDEESKEEEESEKSSNKNKENSKNDDYDISEKNSEKNSEELNSEEKPRKSLKEKTEELPAANAPFKTDLEKFQDEIKKFQKFSFIELYWFILRKKHRIISLLIRKDIYDIFSIKLSLLILSYTIDFFVTTLFFFNFEIRKLFHEKKHLEPIYIIFMGIFCILISTFLIKVVDFLMEYRTNFRRYEILQKYENDRSNYFSSLNAMIKNFKQKMIIYYAIMFAFSVFTWYMVSAFIATHYNTKLIWGCMIGINFGLSNIFPFIYYFFGVLFQYKGIHSENYKMYKLGLIMLKI